MKKHRHPIPAHRASALVWLAALLIFPALAFAEADNQELAKELQNPVAALVSVPFQFNYDQNIGPDDDGKRLTVNIQPVIPFSLNDDWNLISRTIVPVIYQEDIFPGASSQFGISDTVQSLFFSPVKPVSGWILGAGPVFLLPTGTDPLMRTQKWGAGPTGVALRQTGPWTYGALANHLWSVAGSNDRPDINASFFQPFLSYTTPQAWSFFTQLESTYDWSADQWTMPLQAGVSKVVSIAGQPVSFSAGCRYYLETLDSGPEGWGFRFATVLLFPK